MMPSRTRRRFGCCSGGGGVASETRNRVMYSGQVGVGDRSRQSSWHFVTVVRNSSRAHRD